LFNTYRLAIAVACMAAIALSNLAGCASTIERLPEITNHKLAAKVSTKNDIVNAIGLPRAIERDG
jgi:hypothetical protein